jgi:hypothetical protein
MKNYSKSTIAIFLFSAFSFTSCLDLAPGATDAEASLNQSVHERMTTELPLVACDYDSRKTTQLLKEKTGVVMAVNDPSAPDQQLFLIQIPNEGIRYTACNMPQELKSDGMKVTFNAEEKEIYPEERWIAHPMKLTEILNTQGGGSLATGSNAQ